MNETVQVGCRIGSGLVLRVFERVDSLEIPGQKVPREIGSINLNGPRAEHFRKGRAGAEPDIAYTAVDKRLFDLWYEENKDSALVKDGAVVLPGAVAGEDRELSDDEMKERERARIVAAGQLSTGGSDARIGAVVGAPAVPADAATQVAMPQETDEETRAKVDRMNGDTGAGPGV